MKVFNFSDYFKIHILKNITFQHYSLVIQNRPPLKCSYQNIRQEKLTNANRKFAYHKYLTTNQVVLKNELQTTQIHKHKQTCRKKGQFVDFNFENLQ
jgi:hypothetical protein